MQGAEAGWAFCLAAGLWGYTGEHLSGQSQASDFSSELLSSSVKQTEHDLLYRVAVRTE